MGVLLVLGLVLTYRVKPGWRVGSYLFGYGVGRFVIEEFRGDRRGDLDLVPGLSPSQQTSLIFVLVGCALLSWKRWKSVDSLEP